MKIKNEVRWHLVSDCRKTPICKQVGVKFMPNYA